MRRSCHGTVPILVLFRRCTFSQVLESNFNPSPIFGPLLHPYEGLLSSCFSLLFHNKLQQTSHTHSYISNFLILYSYQVTTMRIIFNYCFIFAPCICNSYFSNRYILNDPFSDDRILNVTIHNGYISNCYFERPIFQQLYFGHYSQRLVFPTASIQTATFLTSIYGCTPGSHTKPFSLVLLK